MADPMPSSEQMPPNPYAHWATDLLIERLRYYATMNVGIGVDSPASTVDFLRAAADRLEALYFSMQPTTADDADLLDREYELTFAKTGGAVRLTGRALLKQLIADNRVPARVECISWNPVGVKRINDLLAQYRPVSESSPRE